MTAARTRAKLVAVDGVDAPAVLAVAKAALAATTPGEPAARGGVSRWDASGIFQDLEVAEEEAGAASARTLLLLYAADLAFRLRWQIRPALAEGRTVVAAPYVDTAIAFGRAAGLPSNWLANLFRFAPRAAERHVVATQAAGTAAKDGFVAFASLHVNGGNDTRTRQRLITRTAAILARARPAARRRRSPRARS